MTIVDILGDPTTFLKKMFAELQRYNIDVSELELDHICYRVETRNRYVGLCDEINKVATLLSEKHIGDRTISTFKLRKPLEYNTRNIWCVEIPSPKKNHSYREGYEHIEFVVNTNLETFISAQKATFNTTNMQRDRNPEVSLRFPTGVVKFHPYSLENLITVIEAQENKPE